MISQADNNVVIPGLTRDPQLKKDGVDPGSTKRQSSGMTVRIVLSFLLFLVSATHAEKNEFRITQIDGPVAIIPKGAKKASPVKTQLVLKPGDRLVTGKKGKVELATKEGTVFEIKEKSHFEVDSLDARAPSFSLKVGRLWARFKKGLKRKRTTSIRTPVAVASVRGTDMALVVHDEIGLEAGVIEGEVDFSPPVGAPKDVLDQWEDNVIPVTEATGLIVKPHSPPLPTSEIPPLIVDSLVWFESLRERIPALREEWKDLDVPSQKVLRQEILKEEIVWEIPERFQKELFVPDKMEKLPFDIVPPELKKPQIPKP